MAMEVGGMRGDVQWLQPAEPPRQSLARRAWRHHPVGQRNSNALTELVCINHRLFQSSTQAAQTAYFTCASQRIDLHCTLLGQENKIENIVRRNRAVAMIPVKVDIPYRSQD